MRINLGGKDLTDHLKKLVEENNNIKFNSYSEILAI